MRKLVLATVGVAFAGVAVAQALAPAKPEDAVRYRQSVLFVMSQHVGAMAAMVRGDRPFDQASFVANATTVDTLAKMPWEAIYVPGADQGKHRVKPEAFKEKDKVMANAKRLQDATAALVTAAKSGDQGQIKTAFGAVGGACKNCHDSYRTQ